MKALIKNMEAIFLAAVALTCVTTYAAAEITVLETRDNVQTVAVVAHADTAKMQTVTVHHKRLSAEEKAALN